MSKIDSIRKNPYEGFRVYIDYDMSNTFYGFIDVKLETPMEFDADEYYDAKVLVFVTSEAKDNEIYNETYFSGCYWLPKP